MLADLRVFDDAVGEHLGIRADAGIPDEAVGPDPHARREMDFADEHGVHVDEYVALDGDLAAAHVDARRVRERGAGHHQLARPFHAVACLDFRKLDAVVDAEHLGGARRKHGLDAVAGFHGEADDVGEVILALGILRAEPEEPAPQASGGGRHQSGVGFLDHQLVGARVLVLDDGPHQAHRVAHDAAVTRRLIESDGQDGKRPRVRRDGQRLERGGPYQRYVAIKHEDGMVVGNGGHGLHDGVPGAELLRLQHPVDLLVVERGTHLRTAMPVYHVHVRRIERAGGADHMLQERLSRERLQDLGQVRVHALALSRGEYDDGKRHDSSSRSRGQRFLRRRSMAFN